MPRVATNDTGSKVEPKSGQPLIDATASRSEAKITVDRSFFGNMENSVKTNSGFALTGAALFFIFAVSERKESWFMWTLGGLVGGAAVGYGVSRLMYGKNEILVK